MKHALRALLLLCLVSTQAFAATPKAENLLSVRKTLFTENKGQIADQNGKPRSNIKYLYAAPGLRLALKANGFSYEVVRTERYSSASKDLAGLKDLRGLSGHASPDSVVEHIHRVDIAFVGANAHPAILAEEAAPDYKNYYLAHTPEEGVTNVRSFARLIYKNLYPNIDLIFYAKEEGKLKYDFILHPGARLSDIKMQYAGQSGITAAGAALKVFTSSGEVQETIPASYYEGGTPVEVGYKLANNVVGFAAQGVEKLSKRMVIDPQLLWGTYMGGSGVDWCWNMALDDSGNIYMTGYTNSSSGIATSGAHQTSVINTKMDVFLSKFSPSGKRSWGTYYGGSNTEYGNGLALDKSGNSFIVGQTSSTSGIATSGAHQTSYGGDIYDAFLAKFTSLGKLIWGTYYGGSGNDGGIGIALDALGGAYISGSTESTSGIATSGTQQTRNAGNEDAFLAKFTSSGTRSWGTYFGGSATDYSHNVALDDSANAYITGQTQSTSGIATSGVHQISIGGSIDAFVAKFNSSGKRIWSTYFGGSKDDASNDIAIGPWNSIYITGTTVSASGIATTGAHQTSNNGGDVFLAKFTSFGTRQWGTYYGGSKLDAVRNLALDPVGNAFITGSTKSTWAIATSGAHQTSYSGGLWDAYIAKFNSYGKRDWGTYFGGSGNDYGTSLYFETSGSIYIAGQTSSASGIATSGAFQTSTDAGAGDAFLAKFEIPCSAPLARANDTASCLGTNMIKAKGAVRYRWYASPIAFTPLDTSAAYTPTLTRSDTFYLAGYDGTCESPRDTVIVTVHPKPSPTLTGQDSVCENTTYSYRAGKNAGSSYRWVVAGGTATSGTDSITVNWGGAGAGSVRLAETNAQGCSDSILLPVTIHPTPNAAWTARHLSGRSYAFKANDTTHTDYFWQFGDGNGDTGHNVTHAYGKDSIFNVSLRVINGQGCQAIFSDTVVVRLTALAPEYAPLASLRVLPNPFRESATLTYSLPKAANVKVQLHDAQGRLLAQPVSGRQSAGNYSCVINAAELKLAPGIYLLKMRVDEVEMTRQIIRLW